MPLKIPSVLNSEQVSTKDSANQTPRSKNDRTEVAQGQPAVSPLGPMATQDRLAQGNHDSHLGFDVEGGTAKGMKGKQAAAPEQGSNVVDGICPPSLSTECPQNRGDCRGSHS